MSYLDSARGGFSTEERTVLKQQGDRPPSRHRKTYYKCNHIGYLIVNARHIQNAEQVVDF